MAAIIPMAPFPDEVEYLIMALITPFLCALFFIICGKAFPGPTESDNSHEPTPPKDTEKRDIDLMTQNLDDVKANLTKLTNDFQNDTNNLTTSIDKLQAFAAEVKLLERTARQHELEARFHDLGNFEPFTWERYARGE